uniref:peptidyl-tRNA hydrolase n=1 Tax=Dermatophagoides pteronyssinus TaxID=6956 RepID=A0A6P6XQ50_DERPT|nr:putative peptidyl-tRNA hydrolase PTRHD1 [Dermatophagoides pteronyssinus]
MSFCMKNKMANNIVQYVIVRGDLKWPTGALIGQGCHASVAAIYKYLNEPETTEYLANLDRMTKLVLKAESEEQILKTSELLTVNQIKHYLWREQPENYVTSLATAPYDRNILRPLLQDYKLFR